MKKQQKVTLTIGVIVVGTLACIQFVHGQSEEKRVAAEHADQQRKIAEVHTVLPSGTEETWMAYVDRRVDASLRRDGDSLQLIDPLHSAGGMITYVSINSPYKVSCDDFGSRITFGSEQRSSDSDGVDDNSVAVYGMLAGSNPPPPEGVRLFAIFNTPKANEPEQPIVSPNESPAANELRARLCEHVVQRVRQLLSTKEQGGLPK